VPGPRREVVAQLAGVLVGQVDLVRDAIEGEGHRLGSLSTVDVVDQHHFDTLSHVSPSAVVGFGGGYPRIQNSRARSIYMPPLRNAFPSTNDGDA
jgi:hypothetical protein